MNAPEFSDVFPLDSPDESELAVHADDLFGRVASTKIDDGELEDEPSPNIQDAKPTPDVMPGFFSSSHVFDESLVSEDDEEAEEEAGDAISSHSFMQNRELSWLTFNERVLDQGADESVPLLERLNFISIFWSNLQEFFMVRVGSLTDLTFIEPPVKDSKTGMTPKEQIKAIHKRCRELYPIQESYYEHVRGSLAKQGVRHLRPEDLSDEQRNYLAGLVNYNIMPFLSPQIINPRHPFPHLENGKLYILVRLDDEAEDTGEKKKKGKKAKKAAKLSDGGKGGAEGVVLGLIPLPHQCERVIKLPGRGFQFILLEHAIEMFAADIFSMYTIKHTNVICVTRNADIDANQTGDEQDEDYREHMKRLLKQRARLAPVRLECERPLSPVMQKYLLKKLRLKRSQVYDTIVPLDLSFTWGLGSRLSDSKRQKLSNPPFTPAWPAAFDRKRRIMDQVCEKEVLLSYPYESMDPFVQLLKEAAFDPSVISIKITLYRLASQSQLAEALIAAAENGKEVTALFELRARFDESNNIEWSQRFEQAGCNVIYGFRDYKVHSKICSITRQLPDGSLQQITQLGTGNYNEKTAKLYTDLSFITTDETFGKDATEFFRNMQLESVSDRYRVLCVAPLQIKPMILGNFDKLIAVAREGRPCGAFLKANSITDVDVIQKIAEASQAGVHVTLFVRGICCLVPEVKGATENVRVVSIVGRLLEHSRIYCFSTEDDCTMYLSSADLMTRNLNKRVEIAWPILNPEIRARILDYIEICMSDTAKLRELRPNSTYTPLGAFCDLDEEGNAQAPFDAQVALIERAAEASRIAEARFAALDAEEQAGEEGPAPEVEAQPEPEQEIELEPEAELESESESEPEAELEPVAESQIVSEDSAAVIGWRNAGTARLQVAQACEPKLEADPEPADEEPAAGIGWRNAGTIRSQIAPVSEPEPAVETELEPAMESKPEVEVELVQESGPEAEIEPQAEPELAAEKPAVAVGWRNAGTVRSQVTPICEPEPEIEADLESVSESGPVVETEPMPEPVLEAEPALQAESSLQDEPETATEESSDTVGWRNAGAAGSQAVPLAVPEPDLEPESEAELDERIESAEVDDVPDLDSEHELYLEFDMQPDPEDRVATKTEVAAESLTDMTVGELLDSASDLATENDEFVENADSASPEAEELSAEENEVPLTELTIEEIMAPIEQMMAAQLEEAKEGESIPDAENGSAQEQQTPGAEGEPKTDFFDEPNRELEMPPKKKGFFARLFG